MYRISQLSKLSGISVKALRYYDEEGLLKPSFRNSENQYRYYNDKDLQKAFFIKNLRSLQFSIMEIKEILEYYDDEEDLTYVLKEKITMIEANISKEKERIERIAQAIPSTSTPLIENKYNIDTLECEDVLVAYIPITGPYQCLDQYVPQLYKHVKGHKRGHHFNCYFDEDCVENATMQLCIPVDKPINDNVISSKRLPRIKALQTIHYGTYETLYLAYKALFTYANAHDIAILTPTREEYIKGPGMIFKGNSLKYETKILLPFEIL